MLAVSEASDVLMDADYRRQSQLQRARRVRVWPRVRCHQPDAAPQRGQELRSVCNVTTISSGSTRTSAGTGASSPRTRADHLAVAQPQPVRQDALDQMHFHQVGRAARAFH